MNDRELLEYAAKAAGIKLNIGQGSNEEGGWIWPINMDTGENWFPLTDDGDALRLAMKIGINIDTGDQSAWHRKVGFFVQEYWGGDYDPCYRRAIVRAAAEIGKAME